MRSGGGTTTSIKVNNEVPGAYIAAIEYSLPSRVVTNSELAIEHPDWQMEHVALRTGVETRHWCTAEETALDLAERACRKLFARLDPAFLRIDAVLFCTQSPDYVMPPNGCLLQHRLGLPRSCAALDFSLACSGFLYGLYLARALVLSGSARQILLVAAETYSKLVHPDDRGPVSLFGDGAAATLIAASKDGIGECRLGTDGSAAECFFVPAGGARLPRSQETALAARDENGNCRSLEHIVMNGHEVLEFVKCDIPSFVRTSLKDQGISLDDIDLVIFHQASRLALDYLHRSLHVPPAKQFSNLRFVGNVVSASIPILLRDAELGGVLLPGMRVLLVGFGVGLSWGCCVVTWM